MHNQMIASSGMDHDGHIAQEPATYGNESWVDMTTYHHHQQATMPDYGGSFGYMPPISHGLPSLPSESLHRMPPPPPPPPQAMSQGPPHPHPHSHPHPHTQLPMLMMPSQPTWPSMLTNPNGYSPSPHPHSAPAVVMPPPVPAPLKTTKLPALQTTPSQPRKTLTDDDRRAMCQYAEDHPTAKQTDIGAIFGVERSTVSKVLRNKEKYLSSEDRSSSPIKRPKGKGADIEKALTNFIKNQQRTGKTVTGDDLRAKAHLFSSAGGGSAELLLKGNGSAWLEKFMQKNGIGGGPGKLLRRASETNIPDAVRTSSSSSSSSLTPLQPASAISPSSPAALHPSPSPLSASRADEDREGGHNMMEFGGGGENGSYRQPSHSQSTTSLSSAFTEAGASSFSGSSALSPTAQFTFSPDSNIGGGSFLAAGDHPNGRQDVTGGPGSANFQRPRSQTFPTLDLEYMNQAQSGTDPLTPKYHVSSTAPSSALESPANEMPAPHFGLDQAMSPPQLHHSASNSSLGRSVTTPITTSAVGSSPSSPTQEDARKAADTLLSFIQSASGFVDQNEYLTVVRLTEKLRIHQAQLAKASAIAQGMGGLSRIPEGDSEMTNAPAIKSETAMGA